MVEECVCNKCGDSFTMVGDIDSEIKKNFWSKLDIYNAGVKEKNLVILCQNCKDWLYDSLNIPTVWNNQDETNKK